MGLYFHIPTTFIAFILSDAVYQIQDDDPESADVVIIGGQDSDLNDQILNATGLPEEIVGEVEVFNIWNDEIERPAFDGEDSDVEPPPSKKHK